MQLKGIKNDIEVFQTFEAFTEAQEAIAAFRIKRLRDSVVQNRLFLTELGDLYNSVKQYYFLAQQGSAKLAEAQQKSNDLVSPGLTPPGPTTQKDKKEKRNLFNIFGTGNQAAIDPKNIRFLDKNGKNVALLLTSNTGFYGGILKNLFDNFINYITTNQTEVAIVGKAGRIFYEEILKTNKNVPRDYLYFDMDDEKPTEEELSKIILTVRNYEGIVVHYVQFFSVLTQIPYYTNIAGEMGMVGEVEKGPGYIFEPSYEEILTFFETQILGAIFNQKIYEHQLARYGSKLVAMDDAVSSSKEQVAKLKKRGIRLKKQIMNKKQQEVFSAILGLEQGGV